LFFGTVARTLKRLAVALPRPPVKDCCAIFPFDLGRHRLDDSLHDRLSYCRS
jgi:hypothetical protein